MSTMFSVTSCNLAPMEIDTQPQMLPTLLGTPTGAKQQQLLPQDMEPMKVSLAHLSSLPAGLDLEAALKSCQRKRAVATTATEEALAVQRHVAPCAYELPQPQLRAVRQNVRQPVQHAE